MHVQGFKNQVSILKGTVHLKNSIGISYTPSHLSEPIRLSFISKTKRYKIFLMKNLTDFCPQIEIPWNQSFDSRSLWRHCKINPYELGGLLKRRDDYIMNRFYLGFFHIYIICSLHWKFYVTKILNLFLNYKGLTYLWRNQNLSGCSKNILICVLNINKVIQVWNGMKVNKLWQIFPISWT